MRVVLRRGNDQVVTLLGLKTTDTKVYLNLATVTGTLFDSKGHAIPGFQNVPMTYVPDSEGNYEWLIEGVTMMLPKNVEYTLEIKAVQSGLNYRSVNPVSVVDGAVA